MILCKANDWPLSVLFDMQQYVSQFVIILYYFHVLLV